MTGARSFVRLTFAGFFVSALIVACTVKTETADTTVSCHPGDYKDCTCSGSGKPGQKECNDNGDGYEACICSTTTEVGGNANGGEAPVSNGGTNAYAGTANGGSISYAGEAAGGAGSGAGPVEVGGAGGAGGAGGDVTPLECQDPADTCETCYFGGCCEQYAPCVNDDSGTCLQQVADVLACTDAIKATRNVKTADLVACAQQVGSTQGTWSDSLSPLTVDVVNCIAGEPGWDASATWGPLACKSSCFDQ